MTLTACEQQIADSPVTVEDGTYQIGPDDSLVDYVAKWSYGYIVGTGDGFTTPFPPSAHGIVNTARMRGWRLFGVWQDSETGIHYVDEVVHVDTLSEALVIAKANGELAVWSLFEGREVRV